MTIKRHVIKQIPWETIHLAWELYLWPTRSSRIESHSAMTWPFEGTPPKYDMAVFDYKPTFWGAFHNGILIGVNGGHKTSSTQYRLRGLWVGCSWRKDGIGTDLINAVEKQAIQENCSMIWAYPRDTSVKLFERHGYETVGNFEKSETSEANIYAVKRL